MPPRLLQTTSNAKATTANSAKTAAKLNSGMLGVGLGVGEAVGFVDPPELDEPPELEPPLEPPPPEFSV